MPYNSQQRLSSLIGSIYDTAPEASVDAWKKIYLEMADLFSSRLGGLAVYSRTTDEIKVIICTVTPDLLDEYSRSYHRINPFREILSKLQAGERLNRQEYMSDDDFRSSALYRKFLSPLGVFHFEYQVFLVEDGLHGSILFTRPEEAENFNDDEISTMRLIMPHMERAFRVYINVFDVQLENKIMAEAFDRIPENILVVDRNLKVVFANTGGRDIIELNDGLRVDRNGILHASSQADTRQLRAFVDAEFAERTDGNHVGRKVLQIPRPTGLRPIELLISSFTAAGLSGIAAEPVAIVFASDPEQKFETTDVILRQIYGLTASEARVTKLLTDGKSSADICDLLVIKQNTFRTHLKHIFSKTETRRQSGLIQLILKGPAGIKPR
jgi:DNA-binding CsgD family transcriptional regulator/PAS domain-containing protein